MSGIVRDLEIAINALEEIVDLGPGFRFDFGTETSPLANGYTKVSDSLVYEEEAGFGFTAPADGSRDQGDPDDLRRDFILANGSEFVVDVADGEYDVRIITGAQTDSNDTSFTLEDGDVQGGTRTEPGEFAVYTDTVEVSDGQLNIGLNGEWARVNAIEVVAVEDFQVKYDFGSANSPVAYGYQQVANNMLYDSERGYGLNKSVAERDRGEPDDMRRDFVIDGNYEFIVDLRNGNYELNITAGDLIASNTSTFAVEGESIGRIAAGAGEFDELTAEVTVTDGQLVLEIGERINGLEISYIAEESEEPIDVSALVSLIEEAKQISNEDGKFTAATYQTLQEAIVSAEDALETIAAEEELAAHLASLQQAIEQLEETPPAKPGNGKGPDNNPGKGPNNNPGKGPNNNPGKGPDGNPGKGRN
ncbi:hypothetical protein [Alkalicoccus daliensis]|uniref:hypothetical protein n=1 Tax=Alkalicoccus daliensis TaxID=745820 RepID=UPI003139C2A8